MSTYQEGANHVPQKERHESESLVNTDWVLIDRSNQYIGYARGYPTTNLTASTPQGGANA